MIGQRFERGGVFDVVKHHPAVATVATLALVAVAISRLDVEPVRLVYEDAKAFKIDPGLGFAVPETDV